MNGTLTSVTSVPRSTGYGRI